MSIPNRNPVDAHVGGRVKLRRGIMGLSQTQLGNELGITFQQVQKYEKGLNRIGASRLYHIAQALEVPVQYFFEGLDVPGERGSGANVFDAFIHSPTGIELCRSFTNINDPQIQSRVLRLVQAMGEAPSGM